MPRFRRADRRRPGESPAHQAGNRKGEQAGRVGRVITRSPKGDAAIPRPPADPSIASRSGLSSENMRRPVATIMASRRNGALYVDVTCLSAAARSSIACARF